MDFVGSALLPDPVMVEERYTHRVLVLVAIILIRARSILLVFFCPSGGAVAMQCHLFTGSSPEKNERRVNTKSKVQINI